MDHRNKRGDKGRGGLLIAFEGREINKKLINSIHKVALEGLTPDLTLVLDIDPEVGRLRIMSNLSHGNRTVALDRMDTEDMKFRTAVRIGYRAIAADHPGGVKLIDANSTIDQVFDLVKTYVKELLTVRNIALHKG